MKILQISNYFFPHLGGIEQVARDTAKALSAYEHRIICFNHAKGTVTDTVDGVPITRVGCQAKLLSQSIALGYGKVLKQTLRDFAPDLVIFHFPNPFVGHFLLRHLKKRHFKFIVWYHLDITKQKVIRAFFNRQTHKLLQAADKVIASTPNYLAGSKFLTRYQDKCVVMPYCVDATRFADNAAVSALVQQIKQDYAGKTLCLAVGRHIPYKGTKYLVAASPAIRADCQILIGGTGPLSQKLQRQAAGDPKITFLGRLSNTQLTAYYQACDLFCFPSITKNEAFGLALAEAMYFAKPAVTFTIPGSGVNYVCLAGTTGLEVPNRDSAAYARAVNQLAADPAYRAQLGQQAQARYQKYFTFAAFQRNLEQLMEEIQ